MKGRKKEERKRDAAIVTVSRNKVAPSTWEDNKCQHQVCSGTSLSTFPFSSTSSSSLHISAANTGGIFPLAASKAPSG